MPVCIHCSDCQHGLCVPSEMLGRRVKCPGCGTHFEASLSAVESTSPDVNDSVVPLPDTSGNQMSNFNVVTECLTGATNQDGMIESKKDVPNEQPADAWFVMTHHSDCFGPVTRQELDQWMDESRIGADYHILQQGTPQWLWASDVYPQLNTRDDESLTDGEVPSANVDTPTDGSADHTTSPRS